MHYNPWSLAISTLIAIFAAYTALDLTRGLVAARGRERWAWLATGSLALGTGIWSMHFVGMLAYSAPGLRIAYDVQLVLLSVVAALVGSSVALSMAARGHISHGRLALAALAMGGAVSAMHYIGMAAMRANAPLEWNPKIVALSAAVAVAASWVAVRVESQLRVEKGRAERFSVPPGAVGTGLATTGMHYISMAAATWGEPDGAIDASGGTLLPTPGLTVLVALATLGVLAVALSGSLVRRSRLADENARLADEAQQANERLASMLVEMRRRTEEAEEANRVKSEFLAVMSHELRTPLTAMLGYSELLLDGIPEPLPARSQKSVQRVYGAATHLLHLIEEMLVYARIEAAREDAHLEPLSVQDVMEAATDLTGPLAEAKGLTLHLDCADAPDRVVADARKLGRVLTAVRAVKPRP
jgi:NO-binding membrane sensor protein with MHYT domain